VAKDRTLILDEVRIQFDRAMRSDYRAVADLVQWAPALLPTTDFKRAIDLIAEAVATRPDANKVVRLAIDQSPRRFHQAASTEPWFSPDDTPNREPEPPTVLRTGERSLFLSFVEILRRRIKGPADLERLIRFLAYINTLTLAPDTLYAGSLRANPFGTFSETSAATSERPRRATANLSFSQLSGATWAVPKLTARLSVTSGHGLLLAEYQTIV
jgi:hypothetical protein